MLFKDTVTIRPVSRENLMRSLIGTWRKIYARHPNLQRSEMQPVDVLIVNPFEVLLSAGKAFCTSPCILLLAQSQLSFGLHALRASISAVSFQATHRQLTGQFFDRFVVFPSNLSNWGVALPALYRDTAIADLWSLSP